MCPILCRVVVDFRFHIISDHDVMDLLTQHKTNREHPSTDISVVFVVILSGGWLRQSETVGGPWF